MQLEILHQTLISRKCYERVICNLKYNFDYFNEAHLPKTIVKRYFQINYRIN